MPPAGVLRITDVTHSTMRLTWDAAPGAVRKYIITYKSEEGDLKEVRLLLWRSLNAPSSLYSSFVTNFPEMLFVCLVCTK